jgi:hypothetical protein
LNQKNEKKVPSEHGKSNSASDWRLFILALISLTLGIAWLVVRQFHLF